MKRLIGVIVLLVMSTQLSFGQQNIDQIFKTFKKEKGVIHINIGSIIMGFAGLFTDTMGVKGVEVMAFESCNQQVREDLKEAMRNLKDTGYETMVSSNENGQRTRVMVKIKKNTVKELVVFTTGDGGALVRIKGNIKPSDIEKIIKEHSNG